MSVTLFIDAIQYSGLYGMVKGKKLLDSLEEQKAYIFVSAQIVDEVLRNKLAIAQISFSDKLKEIKEINTPVPDHLLSLSNAEAEEFGDALKKAQDVRKKLTDRAAEALRSISRSEDDVSHRLEALFDKSVLRTPDEMQRTRDRKEIGKTHQENQETRLAIRSRGNSC